jgi:YidC/Oxa1 family membrane protein insertase
MQASNLFDGPKPSPGVYSPIADKECEQSSSELSKQSISEVSEQSSSERSEQSISEVREQFSSELSEPSSSERREQCSSELSDGIGDLENRAKSRGESQQ